MFVNSLTNFENKNVSIIGEIEKIDNDIIFIRSGNKEIMVKHNGLDSYKTKIVRIKGIVENGILNEQVVNKISEGFDLKLYERFVEINSKFPSIF
ncbi:replication protein A 14 kDa subunit [Vairimorpha necatrix]|uniref:Replication protein A 14 kDa subunit n=1 Tax=Vairimorpha necatrix TaxID=6039 RepID=A0AAX4JFS1_9MICR